MIKAIINARIYDFNQYFDHGYLVFDEQIIECGPMAKFVDHGYQIIDAKGQLVMPGLVCGHAHIYSTFARGLALAFHPENFQDILDQLWWRIDAQIDNQITYNSGLAASIEFMQNGVTTIIDHHASGGEIKGSLTALKRAVCDRAGLRGVFAFEVSDRYDTKLAIGENRQFCKKYHGPMAAGLFGLHASMSLSEKTLRQVKKVLGTTPIHIHVAESKLDQLDAQEQYHESVIARLDRHGLLNPKSILVHAVDVSADELAIIKARNCQIAVNFTSNMNNAVGLPNLSAFRAAELDVILGNDGISSGMANEYLAAYYGTHHLTGSPLGLGLGDLLKMIKTTYQTAGELLGVKLGAFNPGYAADILLIPYDPPTLMNRDNAFGHLFFGLFHAFKPQEVFVGGRNLVHHYQVRNKRLIDEYQHIRANAAQLWVKIEKGA